MRIYSVFVAGMAGVHILSHQFHKGAEAGGFGEWSLLVKTIAGAKGL